MPERVWTIGHSTRALDDFVSVLGAHGIRTLCDVRAFPGSRRHPHFSGEALAQSLPAAGIAYEWLGDSLGGRRRSKAGPTRHVAIRSPSFRAYADHMESPEFARGLDRLLDLARAAPTAIMCAEMLWWQCQRSFISDALEALRGVEVFHIADARKAAPHKLKPEARVDGDQLVYDSGAEQGSLFGE